MTTHISPQVDEMLDQAEHTLDHGDPSGSLDLCDEVLRLAPGHPGAFFVRGDALRMLGRVEEAADSYRAAALARPDHSSSWSSLALTQFELLDFDEAERSLGRSLREGPRDPEAWWIRSLLLERRGDLTGRKRALLQANWLDPGGFPLPPELSDDEVESLVEECLLALHPTLCDHLGNIAIVLEDFPDESILLQYFPPASPLELLGYFSGSTLTERTSDDAWSHLPGTIVIFRRN
ncbi:MAG: tetratricopeptide repeat protein, partial [Myxococcota bacterium]|nr:tetratricopeptide repeat protein [Myxococcota bacterium]